MKTYKVEKPEGTFYSDFDIIPMPLFGKSQVQALFEHGNLLTRRNVCQLPFVYDMKQPIERRFRVYNIRETKKYYYITV